MKFFLGKSSHNLAIDRTQLYREFYEFKKTVSHGFPSNPSCIAYDNHHKLIALGTKNGSIQIYGKPGVEFYYQFENEDEIQDILFIPKLKQLLCLLSDHSMCLLKISSEPSQVSITKLHQNNDFVGEKQAELLITSLALNCEENLLFLGLSNGDISCLNSNDLSKNNEKAIKQEKILKSIEEELKFKPGSVEIIQEHPKHRNKILIGYGRCLIVFWNYETDSVINYFLIEQQLEHLSWNPNGSEFISCHNDGSFNTWSINQEQHECKNSKLPYGPFPCKAIKKIFWHTSNEGEYYIFNGGMPRASYSDKQTVSIIFTSKESKNEKNIALDFSSKIVDFLLVYSDTDCTKLNALVVLAIEEIVVIDLKNPDWPQFKLPYLACLHSSPITCSQYCSEVSLEIYKKIVECSQRDFNHRFSSNEWPIDGGVSSVSNEHNDQHNLLITGHEDGTVRFWDASTIALRHLHTINTSKLFNLNDDDLALIDGDDHELSNDEDENEWPPFKKVGQFDPYSDDPRQAIRKLSFQSEQNILAIGGTAGQLIVMQFNDDPIEMIPSFINVKLIDEKDSFVWKGHGALTPRKSTIHFPMGFQPISLVQFFPPAALTALTISCSWKVISIGTAHGFSLFDYSRNIAVIAKSTLKSANISSVMGGDALISRRKSFKKSLRESFRRLRRSRSQKSKRNLDHKNSSKLQEVNRQFNKYDSTDTKPVERPIEAKSQEDLMSSMIRFLYFCTCTIINNQAYPTFWVGTNSGTLYIYVLINEKNSPKTTSWQLAKEVQLKHKAPIIFIRLVDSHGRPLSENQVTDNEKTNPSRVLICSEEQFKLFSLPNFKTLNKFKLTANEGSRVRRMDIAKFRNKNHEEQIEYSLLCLTNLGDVNIFSSIDFRRKFQHHFIKKEDINGISSLVFTNTGEGFYLKSSSEYQRFSLSSRNIGFLESFID
uniref:Lethal(2) giant larvae -like protein 1 n=1 Tax=Sarcoptes scabiei TaxID=52283 RepID=A0A834R408_SARSC